MGKATKGTTARKQAKEDNQEKKGNIKHKTWHLHMNRLTLERELLWRFQK